MLVAGLGFEAPGLIQLLEGGDLSEVEMYFPYPAPPPFAGRNWDFLQYAAQSIDARRLKIVPVSNVDVPSIFARLEASGASNPRRLTLAPYGPKPMSLAMCLYALKFGVNAVYTQPKYYHPRYSEGEGRDNEGAIVFAYPIRLSGIDLYQ